MIGIVFLYIELNGFNFIGWFLIFLFLEFLVGGFIWFFVCVLYNFVVG